MIRIILFLSCLFFVNASYALGVSPIVIQADATQEGVSGTFTVTNSEETDQEVKLYTTPFTYDEKGYQALKNSPNDLSSYLIFSPKSLTLKPQESRQIRFNARFLPSTAAGEYRTMIFVEQTLANKITAASVGYIPRIGLALYVRVGGVKAEVAVQNATYKDKKLFLNLTNKGKATARPRIVWNLEQSGKMIATNEAKQTAFDTTTLIAEGKRAIEIKAPELEKLSAGNYLLSGTLFWGDHDENNLKFEQSFAVTH